MSEDRKKMQETKPKKGEPAKIPVPKRGEVERDLLKIATSKRGTKFSE